MDIRKATVSTFFPNLTVIGAAALCESHRYYGCSSIIGVDISPISKPVLTSERRIKGQR